MKAVQVVFDETLLARLDSQDEVKQRGRSAVLRRLVADYLDHCRAESIDARYREGYGAKPGLGEEFEGWTQEAAWLKD